MKITNETPINHTCGNMTTFSCDRADLKEPVKYSNEFQISKHQELSDFAEFGAWHAMWIHEHLLGGFQGYDTVLYVQKQFTNVVK